MHQQARAETSSHRSSPRAERPGRSLVELVALWVAYVAMVAFNAGSEALRLNATTSAEVSNEVFAWFAPAGYVFSVWGLIYLGLAIWLARLSMLRMRDRKEGRGLSAQGSLFVLSCALNIAWLATWHYRAFAASVAVIVALLLCVGALYLGARQWGRHALDWAPLSLYLSWMMVATVANVMHVVTRYVPDVSRTMWIASTFALLALLLVVAVAMRQGLGDPVYGLVTLWAAIGLGVRLLDVSQTVGIAVLAVAAAGALAIYVPWSRTARARATA